jgi:hypothetical protein
MEEHASSIWGQLAANSPIGKHEEFKSLSLPEQDVRSKYAVDLAAAMTNYITFESFGVKIRNVYARDVWLKNYPVVAFGLALAELALVTNQERVVSSQNAAYLGANLESYVGGLGVLAGRHDGSSETFSMTAAAVASRVTRTLDSVVEGVGGKYRRKAHDPMMRMAYVSIEAHGSLAGVEHFWRFLSSEDKSEIYRPLLVHSG